LFCDLFSGYQQFLGKEEFDYEGFISTKGEEKYFFEKFKQSQMFDSFVRENEILARENNMDKCILTQTKFEQLDFILEQEIQNSDDNSPKRRKLTTSKSKRKNSNNELSKIPELPKTDNMVRNGMYKKNRIFLPPTESERN